MNTCINLVQARSFEKIKKNRQVIKTGLDRGVQFFYFLKSSKSIKNISLIVDLAGQGGVEIVIIQYYDLSFASFQ